MTKHALFRRTLGRDAPHPIRTRFAIECERFRKKRQARWPHRTMESNMKWFVRNFKWAMLASGLLTLSMVHALIAPQAALQSMFGDTLEGPLAEILVRNWGALIALVGAMLIYGAFRPHLRTFVLTIAGISKVTFICLILSYGSQYLGKVGLVLIVDCVMIALFIVYLVAARHDQGEP